MTKKKFNELILKYGKSIKNTGETSVQLLYLKRTIEMRKVHIQNNKKDYKSLRKLIQSIQQYKKLIKYLCSQKNNNYEILEKDLKSWV